MKHNTIIVVCFGILLAIFETDSWGACGGVTSTGNVQGKNNGWTHIGFVKGGSVITIDASGKVDFGCRACTCVDSATAGVTGMFPTDVVKAFKNSMDAIKALKASGKNSEWAKKNLEIIKKHFSSTHQANYDQGGVWIKIVKKDGALYFPTQLYYYWQHDSINSYGLAVLEDVDVYAKAHDGGRGPDATKGYGDNKGAYMVSIISTILKLDVSASDPTDNDGDGIPDAIENELALKYAPLVHLPPNDKDSYLPANVDWYLRHVSMRFNHSSGCKDCEVLSKGRVTQSNMHQQLHNTVDHVCKHTNDKRNSNSSSYFFLQSYMDYVHKGSSNPSDWRVYVHVMKTRVGGYNIQYWFFYPYNNYFGIIVHEGDWEHITVKLDANGVPKKAYFAAHGEGSLHDWNQLKIFERTHPEVYSARGSHASYPTAGTRKIKGLLLKIPADDYTYNGGPAWQTWNNLVNIGEKGRPLNGQEFILYSGRWGNFGATSDLTGPVGPTFHGDFNDENK